MKPDIWHNTRTHHTVGLNTVLGSPRSWVNRSLGIRKQEPDLHETSLDPRMISVAGIWRRGEPLPDTGTYSALYRYFDLVDDLRMINHCKPSDFYAVIGMAVAVPTDQIITWQREFAKSAIWIWWSMPCPKRKRQVHLDLDHEHLYRLFDQGLTHNQVARQENLITASVKYVWDKWAAGIPAKNRVKRHRQYDVIIEQLRQGQPVIEIAQKHGLSPAMIYRIRSKYGV